MDITQIMENEMEKKMVPGIMQRFMRVVANVMVLVSWNNHGIGNLL